MTSIQRRLGLDGGPNMFLHYNLSRVRASKHPRDSLNCCPKPHPNLSKLWSNANPSFPQNVDQGHPCDQSDYSRVCCSASDMACWCFSCFSWAGQGLALLRRDTSFRGSPPVCLVFLLGLPCSPRSGSAKVWNVHKSGSGHVHET